ncbi:MAG: hypothetical protein RDV48_13465, partial [Candidatus Eremiobacteraeota bacterium]|nr:hypothetical protein [Candidatus Eremiobacteraeota bacterium]
MGDERKPEETPQESQDEGGKEPGEHISKLKNLIDDALADISLDDEEEKADIEIQGHADQESIDKQSPEMTVDEEYEAIAAAAAVKVESHGGPDKEIESISLDDLIDNELQALLDSDVEEEKREASVLQLPVEKESPPRKILEITRKEAAPAEVAAEGAPEDKEKEAPPKRILEIAKKEPPPPETPQKILEIGKKESVHIDIVDDDLLAEIEGLISDEIEPSPPQAPAEKAAEAAEAPEGAVAAAAVEAPAEAVAAAPAEAAVEEPEAVTEEAPAEAVTEAPVEAVTEEAVKEPAEAAVEEPEAVTEEAPAEAVAEAPAEAVTEAPVEAVTEEAVK